MRSIRLLAVTVLVLVIAALPIQSAFAASISLTVAPNPAPEDGGGTRVTFSGTEVPARGGATIYIGIFGYGGCTYEPAITKTTTELSSGAYALVLTTGDIEALTSGTIGEYSAIAFDASTNALSACRSFLITFDVGGPTVTPVGGVVMPSICVIQLGVQEPNGTVVWLPGYAYPGTPISQCQDKTDVLGQDVLDRTIVIHQFNQARMPD